MIAPIRVAHVIASTGVYGAERWILALIRALDPAKADSTLVNLVDAGNEPSALVRAARFRNIKAVDFPTGGRFNPVGILRFSDWVRGNGFDILHAHGYKSDIYGLLSARLVKKKVISTPHGWSDEEKDWKLKLYESLDRRCLRYLDCVCPLSPVLWKEIQACGVSKKKNIYIPNGVDLDEIGDAHARPQSINGELIVGYVGRLVEGKNIPLLIHAFKKVVDYGSRKNLYLTIVGDGPQRTALGEIVAEMGIGDLVRFTGYCEDALNLMRTFDVFVLASRSEGIPRCVMEAMALGIPVITSDIPGNSELVEHGHTGLMFPPDETGKLAEAILFLLNHPDESREMCRNARERIEKRFSAGRMAEEYLVLYQDLSLNG